MNLSFQITQWNEYERPKDQELFIEIIQTMVSNNQQMWENCKLLTDNLHAVRETVYEMNYSRQRIVALGFTPNNALPPAPFPQTRSLTQCVQQWWHAEDTHIDL